MNPGRNDPCPCGSGKKFKKCCIEPSSRSTALTLSPIEISRLTAYKGDVGQERKEWCEAFISWKTKQLNKITTGQKHIEISAGKHISCSKSCWFCCSQYVGASLQECDAIVYWLSQRDNVRNAFLTQYPSWRKSIRNHEDVFGQVNQAGSDSMSRLYDARASGVFMQKAEAYFQLNILCPFLYNGACSIYPVRPFVCASLVAISPPEYCKSSSASAPVLLLGAPSPDLHPSYFRGPQDSVMFSPAALLVHEIINGGFIYLNDLPGMNGLEEEAFGDPDIFGVLQGRA